MNIKGCNVRYTIAGICLTLFGGINLLYAQDGDNGIVQPNAIRRSAAPSRSSQSVEKSRVKVLERPAPIAAPQVQTAGTNTPNGAGGNEVTKFQGWVVTCFPPSATGGNRSCIGKMNILKINEDRRPIIFLSVIKSSNSISLAIQTPTSVELKSGVNLQFGQANTRRIDYSSCEAALCTAMVQMDDTLANEFASFPTASAAWTGLGIGEVRVEFALQEARNMMAFLATR
ncbi:invasion associated locus B family protein [Methylobacterium persicinum]|uniref:Invasion protein IalB n=1 Tax=Methylobacterium persicinum TaxID=374426 RepID=A0ABU0HS70_9HYPH|nr:invasion associated locus B family protein [Methylobacterium persicinum]MDQ0445189.1 invasion protein IalB [Methylobacterium persicinum]GJE39099.1 hypothetical protein KHHGKMAE_3178 [Methylobacterium persicinum]